MSELKVIKIELNNHGKPIASIQGTTSYYGISPNDTFYPQAEADKVIAELKARIAELKEERRWRNVDDKFPTADEGYILVLWEDGLPDIGYIGAEEDVIETVRDRGEGHSVDWWMPLPSAPKEEK